MIAAETVEGRIKENRSRGPTDGVHLSPASFSFDCDNDISHCTSAKRNEGLVFW
jgi:hypothetical protein